MRHFRMTESPFPETEYIGMTICTELSCCQIHSQIPHVKPLECSACGNINTLKPATEAFFLQNFVQIATTNEGLMKSAFYETL